MGGEFETLWLRVNSHRNGTARGRVQRSPAPQTFLKKTIIGSTALIVRTLAPKPLGFDGHTGLLHPRIHRVRSLTSAFESSDPIIEAAIVIFAKCQDSASHSAR